MFKRYLGISPELAILALAFCGAAGSLQAGCATVSNVTTCTPTNGQMTWDDVNGKFLPYSSDIAVTGVGGPVTAVTVTLNTVNQGTQRASRIWAVLVGPNSSDLVFFGRPCNGTAPNRSFNGQTFTIADGVAGTFPGAAGTSPNCDSGALPSGSYKPIADNGAASILFPAPAPASPAFATPGPPADNATFNSRFSGMAAATANGTWKLYVAGVAGLGATGVTIGAGAGSPAWSLAITFTNATATTTVVGSSLNPSFTSGANSSVTLTAQVSSTSTVNVGTVTFKDGGTNIGSCAAQPVNGSGQATCVLTFATEGAHVVTATYNGAGAFAGSNSAPITQVVNNHTTNQASPPAGTVGFCNPGTITIPQTGSSGNASGTPSSPYSSEIFVTGQAGIIQGLGVYLNGFSHSQPFASGLMLVGPNGKAFDFMSEAAGGASVSNLNLVIADSGATQIPDASSPSNNTTYKPASYTNFPTTYCQSAACNGVTVSQPAPSPFDSAAPRGVKTMLGEFGGASPNGTWQLFVVDRATGETGSINNWCVNFALAVGAHPTTLSLMSSLNPSFLSDSVTFTATLVNQDNPGGQINEGTVTFLDGLTNIGSGSVAWNGSANVATFTTSNPLVLNEGTHQISATYSGTPNFGFSSSNTIQQVVNRHTSISVVGNTYKFCNAGPITVPAGGIGNPLQGIARPYPSNIFVAHLPGVTNAVTLSTNNYTSNLPNDFLSMVVGPLGAPTYAFDFFSRVGGTNCVGDASCPGGNGFNGANLTFMDGAPAVGAISTGLTTTYRMTSGPGTNTWPAPAPASFLYAAPQGAAQLSAFNAQNNNGTWSLYMQNLVNGAYGGLGDNVNPSNPAGTAWCTNLTQTPPVLAVTKNHSGTFVQGQTVTWTIGVTNNGPGPTGDVDNLHPMTVTDTMPAGMNVTGISATNWTCTNVFPAASITCTRHDGIAAANSYENIVLTVKIDDAATPGPRTNTANASGAGAALASHGDNVTIVAAPDLTITKVANGTFKQGDAAATYTLTVNNLAAKGPTFGTTTVTDTIPAGLTLISAVGTNWTCVVTPPSLSCTSTDVIASPGTFPAITVTVSIASGTTGSVSNTANVSGGGEVVTNNDSSTILTPVVPQLDLTITKSHTGNFVVGGTGNYTVTVTNSGAGDKANGASVSVTDAPPSGLSVTAMSGTGWTCTTLPTCTRTDLLLPGNSYPAITVTVSVAVNASSPQVNSITVTTAATETNSGNNTATDSTVIDRPDLTITKGHTGNFVVGGTGNYTVVVTNSGVGDKAAGQSVSVTDAPPVGLSVTAMSGTGWTCTTLPTCTRTDVLLAGASYPAITVTVAVAVSASSPLTNSITVTTAVSESNSGNNTATDSTTIDRPDLTITKSHTGNFVVGGTGNYTVTVTNSGVGDKVAGQAVSVTDAPPGGLSVTAMSGTGWTCTTLPTCTRSDLLTAGNSYPAITVTVGVAVNASSPQVNSISVTTAVAESNAANNTATDSTTIDRPDLTITKSHTGNFTQGGTGNYTVVVTNSGVGDKVAGQSVSVTDAPPGGLSVTAMSGTGWTCTTLPTCTRSDVLLATASYSAITVTVSVAGNASSPQVNSISVTTAVAESNAGNNTAMDSTNIDVAGAANVTAQMTIQAGTVTLNRGTGLYTQVVTLTNNGAALTNVSFVLDSLNPAYTLTNGNGVTVATSPAGSPYKTVGPLGAGGSTNVTLIFSRSSIATLTYTPRVLEGSPQ